VGPHKEVAVSVWGCAAALLVAGGLAGCLKGRAVVETPSTTVPGSKFKVIATVAGGTRSMDLRMSATARKQLNDSGWKGVARYGRWDTRGEAVTAICGDGDVDGVLFVEYNRLELDDCATKRPAYAIDGSPERGVGLDAMMTRMMRYLRGEQALPPKQ
jgi:hypothetical protein